MEYLFGVGFLGTRAPYYMDGIIVFLLSLPFLILFSIMLAGNGKYRLHRFTQTLLFISTLLILIAFNYGIHVYENFDELVAMGSVDYTQTFYLLVAQTILSMVMLIMWFSTLLFAISDRRRRALPGLYSSGHKKTGRKVFLAVILTMMTNVYLYWIFYIS